MGNYNSPLLSNTELDELLLTKIQCARLLKISVATLDNWRAKGIIKSYKIGQRVLFKKEEVLSELISQ